MRSPGDNIFKSSANIVSTFCRPDWSIYISGCPTENHKWQA